jgi:hypothetical protein
LALSFASFDPFQDFAQAPAYPARAKVNAKRKSACLLETPNVHRTVRNDGQQFPLSDNPVESFVCQKFASA